VWVALNFHHHNQVFLFLFISYFTKKRTANLLKHGSLGVDLEEGE